MRITVTGIDQWTSTREVAAAAAAAPAGTRLEWGVLAGSPTESATRNGETGEPRFPNWNRITGFQRSAADAGLTCSIHLCGRLARAVNRRGERNGEAVDVDRLIAICGRFDRIQVNAASYDFRSMEWLAEAAGRPVIVQERSGFAGAPPSAGLQYLFDRSGGRGAATFAQADRLWPDVPCGLAGGISPANVAGAAALLELLAGRGETATINLSHCWLDVESGVRTGDRLDMEKVRALIANAHGG